MKSVMLVLVCVYAAVMANVCLAGDYYWINPAGGGYGLDTNWNPTGVPGNDYGDTVYFTLPDTYTVTFDMTCGNHSCIVDGGDVILDLQGNTYYLNYYPWEGRAAIIGESATGSLTVNDGLIHSREVTLGYYSDSLGRLTVSGDNAEWSTSFDGDWHGVWIGDFGDAHLSVLDNASFNHGHGLSAFDPASDTQIDVDGIDSEWYVDGQFDMSIYGRTTATITNGGRIRCHLLSMALEFGSSAQINILGVGQETELALDSSGETSLTVGMRGQGGIYMERSKLFNAGGMILAAQPGSRGLLEMHEGTWVDCGGSIAIGGTFDGPGGVGQIKIIDDDRTNSDGVILTPTDVVGEYMVVWPRGTITMDGGELVMEYDAGLANAIILQGGTLQGSGMIWAHVENHGGLVEVKDDENYRKLEIGYNYTQDAAGTLKVALGGVDIESQYATLQVSNPANGQVSLDGMLDVDLTDGFVPSYDNEFIIITAAAITGTFSNAASQYIFEDGSFDVIYNTDSVVLTHFVAEPACSSYPAADLNRDCRVNLIDLALFAGEWLECNYLPATYCDPAM